MSLDQYPFFVLRFMKLFQKLITAPAIISIASGFAVNAAEVNTSDLSDYSRSNNLLSLDFITNIDLTSYDLIIQKAIRQKTSPSPRVQTVEELRYYRDKHLKPYRAEISNLLEHWLAKI